MAISVLVPSRHRPDSILRLAGAFGEVCTRKTYLHVIVDDDDRHLKEYKTAVSDIKQDVYPYVHLWEVPKGPPGIVHPVNYVSDEVFRPELGFCPDVLGFMGDDHIPRTEGWDEIIEDTFAELGTGIVYGNDLLQGERLPTAAFLSRNIVQTLGFVAPRELHHLYVDDYWKDLGRGIGRLKYLPDVILEHLHYLAGKADRDETYDIVNAPGMASHDKTAYLKYKYVQLRKDIALIKGLL